MFAEKWGVVSACGLWRDMWGLLNGDRFEGGGCGRWVAVNGVEGSGLS